MPTIEIKALQLAGGISKQPAHERFPGQVSDASNVVFSLADGGSRRPGSILVTRVTGLTPGSTYRLHPINRDATEKYLLIYAINTLLAFHVDGTQSTIAGLNVLGLTPNPATYYATNNATADQLRLVSIADYTIIANTTVPMGVTVTPTYTVTAEWPNYDQMVSHTPTSTPGSTTINTAGDLTYHRTNNDSAAEPAGYYLYSVSGNTFPTIQFAAVTAGAGGVAADWANATIRGFRIRFEKRQDTFTAGAWNHAAKTLTKANNWASYSFQSGDQMYISGGTNITPGWYTIAQKNSASVLTLTTVIDTDAANHADVTGAGIGQEYRVQFPGTGGQLGSMHEVATFVQTTLQGAGAIDALVEWTDTASDTGYFTITAPWRGSGAKVTVVTTNPSTAGGAVTAELAGAGQPFAPAGATLVLGGGSGPRTLPTNQRWTRVAAPGDADGSIDPTKMPIKLVRAAAASSGTVTGVSVANPSVITTGAAHGLYTNQRVTIAGTNTNASTVGSFYIAVLSPTTFAIYSDVGLTTGINVIAVTSGVGTWTSTAHFTYDFISWNNRTSGTDATNPSPSIFKTAAKISDIGFYRQRFLIGAGEHVVFSAASDLFRFYLDDANNLVDSDPIDAPLSSDRVTIIDYLTPVRDTVMVSTYAGQQYALGAPDVLSPSSVSFTRATTIQTLRVRPVVLDPTLYMAAAAGGRSQLREAFFVDESVPTDAADVSAHVGPSAAEAALLPSSIQTLVAHANSRMVFMLPTSASGQNKVYVYRSFWSGSRKEQSAWTVWTFATGTRISDIAVIDDYLYMLVEHNDGTTAQFAIEKVPLFEPAIGSYPFALHIDRQMSLTGVHAAGTTTWTLPSSISDTTINTIVLQTGRSVTVLGHAGTTVTATGDFSGASATLGRSYLSSMTLSEPFPTDTQVKADYTRTPELGMLLQQQRLIVVFANSGAFNVVGAYEAGDSTFSYVPPLDLSASPILHTVPSGQFCAWASGDLARMSIRIESSAPTPFTIAGYSHHGAFAPRPHS